MTSDTTQLPERASVQDQTQAQTREQLRQQVTGLVLAGGMGRRMQGTDKGLVSLAGREMVAYVIDALRVNVAEVIVNANRNESDYARFGVRVIADSIQGYQGPLAGVEAGMSAAATPWLFTCPCDSPMHSTELLPHMWRQVQTQRDTDPDVVIGMASDGDRTQPVFSLLHTSLLPSLRGYLDAGERKIDRWFAQHTMITVDCSRFADSFVNVNTEQQKQELESRLGADLASKDRSSSASSKSK